MSRSAVDLSLRPRCLCFLLFSLSFTRSSLISNLCFLRTVGFSPWNFLYFPEHSLNPPASILLIILHENNWSFSSIHLSSYMYFHKTYLFCLHTLGYFVCIGSVQTCTPVWWKLNDSVIHSLSVIIPHTPFWFLKAISAQESLPWYAILNKWVWDINSWGGASSPSFLQGTKDQIKKKALSSCNVARVRNIKAVQEFTWLLMLFPEYLFLQRTVMYDCCVYILMYV